MTLLCAFAIIKQYFRCWFTIIELTYCWFAKLINFMFSFICLFVHKTEQPLSFIFTTNKLVCIIRSQYSIKYFINIKIVRVCHIIRYIFSFIVDCSNIMFVSWCHKTCFALLNPKKCFVLFFDVLNLLYSHQPRHKQNVF